jgi:hypothetical protein
MSLSSTGGKTMISRRVLAAITALLAGGLAHAETPADFLDRFQAEARQSEPSFAASSERGGRFFNTIHDRDWSCATCHTRNPGAAGKHATTGKAIQPMAPAVNPERLTSARSVEKWFARNCRDVLGRICSAAEKADVVAYLSNVLR